MSSLAQTSLWLGTQGFYNELHDWLTSFEEVMRCVIAIPYLHGSAHIHLHVATHAMTRDIKAWFDNNHRATLHLRHSPNSRVAVKFSNYTSDSTPAEVNIPVSSPWHDARVRASWDPMVTHPFPCPPPPRPNLHEAQAWNEWYQRLCGLRQAPLDEKGMAGTHQTKWTDPSIKRGWSVSRGPSRAQSSAPSRMSSHR